MKPKINANKEDSKRDQTGKKKKGGIELSAPSEDRHSSVEAELASGDNDSTMSEKVPPKRDGILDELGPSNPPPPPQRTLFGGFTDLDLATAAFYEFMMKQWDQRLENVIHFEEWESAYEGSYHLLSFRGDFFVLDDELARAPLFADRLGPDSPHLVTEIISKLDIRDIIVVPGPEIPASFIGAVNGRYFPLEVLASLLSAFGLGDDADAFWDLLHDLEKLKALRQEVTLRESRLRRLRLDVIDMNEVMYRRTLLSEERYRRALLQEEDLEEKLKELLRERARQLSEKRMV